MDTNEKSHLLLKDEVYQTVGSAIEVLNEIGHGLHEKPYEDALVVEFGLRGIAVEQQRNFEVLYEKQRVGVFVPDLIAYGQVIVDAKVINQISDVERGQILNYLRITKLRVGVNLNFKHPKLEWERIVL